MSVARLASTVAIILLPLLVAERICLASRTGSGDFCEHRDSPPTATQAGVKRDCALVQVSLTPNKKMVRVEDLSQDSQKRSVFYVLRTSDNTKEQRLPSLLQTWAGPLVDQSLLIVGDAASESPKVHEAIGCRHGHWKGLMCKTGHALALAAENIGSHLWAFLVDDDVYVNTTNLEHALMQHDASSKVVLGIPGCGKPHCADAQGGLCGGGGYAISKAALRALVPASETFPEDFVQSAKEIFDVTEKWWDDVNAGCLMKSRGISLRLLEGLYGWRVGSSTRPAHADALSLDMVQAIHAADPVPLTFHYLNPEEMPMVQNEFARPAPLALLELRNNFARYKEHMDQYIHRLN